MKLIKILIAIIIAVLIGGFVSLGFIDMPVEQQEIIKEIPQDKVFND